MTRTLVIAVLLTAVMEAQPSDKHAEVERIFSAFNTHTPGCSVGVAQNGSVVLKAGYGMADLERNVPVTPDTIFASGSVAKAFKGAEGPLLPQQRQTSPVVPMPSCLPSLAH